MALTCTDFSIRTRFSDLQFSILFLFSFYHFSFFALPFTGLVVLLLPYYFLLLRFYYYPNATGYNFVAKMFSVSSSSFFGAMKCMGYAREILCSLFCMLVLINGRCDHNHLHAYICTYT